MKMIYIWKNINDRTNNNIITKDDKNIKKI